MQVQNINNQPNFGIKYINKNTWNPKVLEAFENSKLLKEINAKYPKAETRYIHINDAECLLETDDTYTTLLDIILKPGKKFRWNLTSHNKSVPDKHLIEKLSTLTLDEVEKGSVKEFSPIATIEISGIKKPNVFKRFFNKLFGNK